MSVILRYVNTVTPPINPGDEIRIVSPSGIVQGEYIDGAVSALENWGYNVTVGSNAKNEFGRFAGTDADRLSDLQAALDDKNVKVILCSRGGYGLSRIIDKIDLSGLNACPKLLLGFSDVTFLHSVWGRRGCVSIHSIMAKHLTELPLTAESVLKLRELLAGKSPVYNLSPHPLNRSGRVIAEICGGNLSILYAGRGSNFEPNYKGKILFVEDIGEKSYHIDRMMQNLRLGGVLSTIKGLIVGHFTDCVDDTYSGQNVYEIIRAAVDEYDYPVVFGFPAGHEDVNLPLLFGVSAELVVV